MKKFKKLLSVFLIFAIILGALASCAVGEQGAKGEQGEKGEKGEKGEAGADGKTPDFKIENGELFVSYDGVSWSSLGSVGGADGEDGEDGKTPRLRVNGETREWEVSYDDGATWESLGVKATGEISVESAELDSKGRLVVTLSGGERLPPIEIPSVGQTDGGEALKQSAKDALISYLFGGAASGGAPQYALFESGGKSVALHGGKALGVYASKAAALRAMLGAGADAKLLYASGVKGLWLYPYAPSVTWELGTIGSSINLGEERENATRVRTADFLSLSSFSGVSIHAGWQVIWIAYRQDGGSFSPLGYAAGGFLGSGVGFTTASIRSAYPAATHFRVVLRSASERNLTLNDINSCGVTFYAYGQTVPESTTAQKLNAQKVMSLGSSVQDGAIYGGKLFAFDSKGNVGVYSLDSKQKLTSFTLDKVSVLNPHANSVCFSEQFYEKGDKYPLLYVNIYNNYASAADKKEGTCCVYRLAESGGTFSAELVQVIRVGFAKDALWSADLGNSSDRPYGNFAVDGDSLYAYVMRNGDTPKSTRFFTFALPSAKDGEYSAEYGCPVLTLTTADIKGQFDIEYLNFIQGCTAEDGKILSLEGFSNGFLKEIDVRAGKITKVFALAELGLTKEPELISRDGDTGKLYYADVSGNVYLILGNE